MFNSVYGLKMNNNKSKSKVIRIQVPIKPFLIYDPSKILNLFMLINAKLEGLTNLNFLYKYLFFILLLVAYYYFYGCIFYN